MCRFFREIRDIVRAEGIVFFLFLLTCFTHNMDIGSIVYATLLFILFFAVLLKSYKRYIDPISVFLILFSTTYILFSPTFVLVYAFRCLLGPVLFYIYGRYCVSHIRFDISLVIIMVILMIVSISFPVWWAVISNMLSGNIISTTSEEGSRWLKTWGQSNVVPATTYGVIASFGLCGLGFFIVDNDRFKKMDSWILLVCSICSLLTTLYLINRSGIVIIGLVTLLILLYSSRDFSIKSFLFFFPIAIALIYLFFTMQEIDDIIDAYSNRNNISEGGDRTWRWKDAIFRVFSMPFGWSTDKTVPYTYVHNMWLDIARDAGILPFFAILVATIKMIRINILFFFKRYNRVHLLLLTLFLSVFISYMIEPVIEANIFYLSIFTWIWGVEREVYIREKAMGIFGQTS